MIIRYWRYICLCWDPQTFRCLRWIRIPYIRYIPDVLVEPPPLREPPWLQGENISSEVAHDLRVLATIDLLAQTLSGSHKKPLLDLVQKQFDALELPKGMEVKAVDVPRKAD